MLLDVAAHGHGGSHQGERAQIRAGYKRERGDPGERRGQSGNHDLLHPNKAKQGGTRARVQGVESYPLRHILSTPYGSTNSVRGEFALRSVQHQSCGTQNKGWFIRSGSGADRLDQAANVSVAKCEGLQRFWIRLGQRNVIGHKHVWITDLLINLDRFDKVDITFVREDLDEVVAVAANVAKVHVENFLASAKISNHIKYLHRWVLEIFGDGPLAKVKAVVSTLLDGDEFLEPIHGAQHSVYPLISFRRHARILRMAGHSNLALIGHRNYAVKKIRNTLPESVRVHAPGPREWCCRMSLGEIPCVIHRVTATRYTPGAKNTENAHVVLNGRNASLRTIPD